MYALLQSLNIKGSTGNPLPSVFESLTQRGSRFLRGQLALICAGPGAGKSSFILTYALRAEVPTLYFSADSDSFTQLSRSVSVLTGWSMDRSAKAVREENLQGAEGKLANIPIRFNYDASPSLDRIETVLKSYMEVMGTYPELVVVDNISNVRSGGDDDPFAGLEALMEYMHDMARSTSACVVGLHHVTGSYNDNDKPIPLSGVKGQVSRVPEVIMTLHRVSRSHRADSLRVSTVKNRGGRSDPSGLSYAELEFTGDVMQINDIDLT